MFKCWVLRAKNKMTAKLKILRTQNMEIDVISMYETQWLSMPVLPFEVQDAFGK